MFSQGLSLEQAPPVSVPFRFFLTAPIFGILIGLMFLFSDFQTISNQYSHEAIAVTHLFTLGMLSMIIFGAMQQMMPVLAGAVIKKTKLFATIVHSFLLLGTLFLSGFFLFNIKSFLYIAVLFLSISFLTFSIYSIKLLFQVKFLTSTVKAMRLFSLCSFITLILGVFIASSHINDNISGNHFIFVNAHIIFGAIGFAMILIMGVSFQIIPMFYVALDFPKVIQDKAPIIVFLLLCFFVLFLLFSIDLFLLKTLLVIVLFSFALFGIKSLNNRKRPIFDVTLWYWKLSFLSLIVSLFIWLSDAVQSNYILMIIFSLGFLLSLLQGMVYKIIPFLSWFHLTSKGYFSVPTMREFIDEKYIKINFYLHFVAILLFIISFYINSLINLAAIVFIFSNIIFLINCSFAISKYNDILKTDPMDMSSFNK